MPRMRQLPSLGLDLCVRHPASEAPERFRPECPGGCGGPGVDADGHEVCFEMAPMPGDVLAWVTLRRGISPRTAADLLRKLAALLERHGGRLLNLPRGGEGAFDAEGEPVEVFRAGEGG